ncbi:hypothetical protein [Sapientia aquatica]|uniref:Uncharacterized protein n=1 Tax=Sapientia aquatica TaxID=1549640 RepID=A0A4R5W3Y5_9BURK|nr:hypothetical protein [Sapientia aquatica]TDK67473.1 hypothetical protein E2I14_06900 [Sapientia aquatica]
MQEILEFSDGTIIYLKNGKLHREGGPAIFLPGEGKLYFYEGQLHNDGAPAIYNPDDDSGYWYKHGVRIIPKEKTETLIGDIRKKFTTNSDSGNSSMKTKPKI